MTSVIRIILYGVVTDTDDDYVRIGAIESLKHFCNAIIEIFGPEYLKSPTTTDIARLLAIREAIRKKPTIILEAVASYDLWIGHAFFGMPGSHNDLNVLDRSPICFDLAQGKAPPIQYTINGHTYNMGCYLANGIYPQWATLAQTISSPQGANKQHFAMMQESKRKDVERAFRVL
ncbi:uncharacterized protein LOC114263608 [Camellia sinensis]|uniref:uncharacterized protein LOC114263608 n=1 Tax=Camellia sinensis TaxID=4442 RepID=UPI001035CD61|nr:uncharacterized protein LOC114263608 [Camellia sinensis]